MLIKGYLFQVHFEKDLIVDDIYQFVVTRNGSKFKCGYIKFDINDTYKDIKKYMKNIFYQILNHLRNLFINIR